MINTYTNPTAVSLSLLKLNSLSYVKGPIRTVYELLQRYTDTGEAPAVRACASSQQHLPIKNKSIGLLKPFPLETMAPRMCNPPLARSRLGFEHGSFNFSDTERS